MTSSRFYVTVGLSYLQKIRELDEKTRITIRTVTWKLILAI